MYKNAKIKLKPMEKRKKKKYNKDLLFQNGKAYEDMENDCFVYFLFFIHSL